MSKRYFCDKLLDSGLICGETDISKFIEGRYTSCKSCRLQMMSQYNKSKNSKKKDNEAKKVDPDCNIRYLIEDTINRVPFLGQQTIPDRIKSSEEDITEILNLYYGHIEKNNFILEKMQKQIDELQEQNKFWKEKFENKK